MAKALRNPARPSRPALSRGRDRLAAAFLLVLMAVGSLILWIGVPAASSWVAAQLTDEATTHLQITVPVTIAGMVLFARLLFWINRLWVWIVAHPAELDPEDEEEGEPPLFIRGPLEPILVGSLVIALTALTVWFFVLAENPPQLVY
jgi:hypothetical protein